MPFNMVILLLRECRALWGEPDLTGTAVELGNDAEFGIVDIKTNYKLDVQ